MQTDHRLIWRSRAIQEATAHDAGAIIRAFRRAEDLTLAQLGAICGYSASALSRMERGKQPLRDISVLQCIASALSIPPELLGLASAENESQRFRPAIPSTMATSASRVDHEMEGGDETVRRRELLVGLGAVTGAAALGGHGIQGTRSTQGSMFASLEEAVLGPVGAGGPAPLAGLREGVKTSWADFQAARYERLGNRLPALLKAASATREAATGDAYEPANALLADVYTVISQLLVKLNRDDLAWLAADRAARCARDGKDPLALADSRRALATALRRVGHATQAQNLLITTADAIAPDASLSPDHLAAYGSLLQVAAYTAAVDGDRDTARDLIAEAATSVTRLGSAAISPRYVTFNGTGVGLYQLSIAQVLHDNGPAIDHAKAVDVRAIPTPERAGRYWVDVARAFHQWGRLPQCYQALLAAERAAPAEVRYRPPVHRMVSDLLTRGRSGALPDLDAFARRVGVAW